MSDGQTQLPLLMSTEEVAAVFSVAPETIRDWIRMDRFPNALQIGRHWRIPRKDVIALVGDVF